MTMPDTCKQIKVLLIEDDSGDARLIRGMLSDVDNVTFDMRCTDRLSTGLEFLAAKNIEVVLLDLGLPDSSGLDTFARVHDMAPEVPIVMLTDLDDATLAIKGVQAGAQDYLVKGRVDSDSLTRSIYYAIERKKAEKQIEHLNSLLRAVRSVDQLIMIETDRDSFLHGVCAALVDTHGYDAVWLGFLGDTGKISSASGASSGNDASNFTEQFIRNALGRNHPPCIENALANRDGSIITVVDRQTTCGDCLISSVCTGTEAVVIRLEHAGRLFGLLAISLTSAAAADREGKSLLAGVAFDIAFALHNMELDETRKQEEERIQASLDEKEVLLQEIHHRAKNNLQVISSLLNMQARAAGETTAIDALTESRHRIDAMVLIHSQLYEKSDLTDISMKKFVDRLLSQLFQTHPVRDTEIVSDVRVVDHPFPVSVAIPVGLAINELLTNVLLHAFNGRTDGKIEIALDAPENGRIGLKVSDDGIGLPEDFDIDSTGTVGLRLVKRLMRDQLQGAIEVLSDSGGTTFKIELGLESDYDDVKSHGKNS
ncbi:MAG: sensor histidine kinase [Candidatus Methanogasteraceae archaeon]